MGGAIPKDGKNVSREPARDRYCVISEQRMLVRDQKVRDDREKRAKRIHMEEPITLTLA
jgi:hypothetical protein